MANDTHVEAGTSLVGTLGPRSASLLDLPPEIITIVLHALDLSNLLSISRVSDSCIYSLCYERYTDHILGPRHDACCLGLSLFTRRSRIHIKPANMDPLLRCSCLVSPARKTHPVCRLFRPSPSLCSICGLA
jgi:hypothetical protein